MSTPAFQIQSVNGIASPNGATAFTVQCNTIAGVGVNISSGYVAKVLTQQSSNANPVTSSVNVTSNCTFTYGSTGLLTVVMAAALAATLQGQQNNASVLLSNDAGTTESVVGQGSISISRSDIGS